MGSPLTIWKLSTARWVVSLNSPSGSPEKKPSSRSLRCITSTSLLTLPLRSASIWA